MSERGGESKNVVDNANFSLALLQLTVHDRRGGTREALRFNNGRGTTMQISRRVSLQ